MSSISSTSKTPSEGAGRFARALSCTVMGLEAHLVCVEVDESGGLPSFSIVGLPDKSVSEAKERVKPAVTNSGYRFSSRKIIVNLAPAEFRKEGPAFDLPIALALLCATGQVDMLRLGDFVALGELSLNGTVRGVRGALPMALAARDEGPGRLILPRENVNEAAVVDDLEVYPVETLGEALEVLRGEATPLRGKSPAGSECEPVWDVDFAEIKGQELVKRALEVAAAGGHNILMMGPPGSGKTMLARRIPTILPSLSVEESIEVTKIYSVSGKLRGAATLIRERPFRAPHHSTSPPGLVGGGTVPRPGEVSLAHRGVLFLDEMPEFQRGALEVLRQPMESGQVTIPRARMTLTFPASFMLVGALNPCPCGFWGDLQRACTCRDGARRKYLRKLSGPLIDRIDIQIEVPRLTVENLCRTHDGEGSRAIRARVAGARRIQESRFAGRPLSCNAEMAPADLRQWCRLPAEGQRLLQCAVKSMSLSARAYDRILKVARTIADLAGRKSISADDVAEAVGYRSLDRQ